jgi:hypothetical protein
MYGLPSKPSVFVSKPVKVSDNNKDASLLHFSYIGKSVIFYSTGSNVTKTFYVRNSGMFLTSYNVCPFAGLSSLG